MKKLLSLLTLALLGIGSAWADTFEVVSTYDFSKGDEYTLTKYCNRSDFGYNGYTDSFTELLPEDDAATVNWGSEWQMPSDAQVQELIDENNTKVDWHDVEPRGAIITSKTNGKSIFLPACGYYDGTNLEGYSIYSVVGYSASIWTRSLGDLYPGYAFILFFNNVEYLSGVSKHARPRGHNVRPVRKQGGSTTNLVTRIDLSETSLTLQQGDVASIFATVLPVDADNPEVRWESSERSVAEVRSSATGATVIATGVGTCTIYCRATDGSGVYAECQVTVTGGTSDHEYVDLGLPSGTLWATCNIGANSPEDYGDYFAWGETETKSFYSWGTYKWMESGQSSFEYINKYTFEDDQTSGTWYYGTRFVGDGITELEPGDDAATSCWGSDWRMPSKDQFDELMDERYITTTWTKQNGVAGRIFTSKSNGKSIFLPAAGQYYDSTFAYESNYGWYWSRSLDSDYTDYGLSLFFYSGTIDADGANRCLGMSIRPVRIR